jgi:hypothetical protein
VMTAQTSAGGASTSMEEEILRRLGPVVLISTGRLTHRTPGARAPTLEEYRPAARPAGQAAAASRTKLLAAAMARVRAILGSLSASAGGVHESCPRPAPAMSVQERDPCPHRILDDIGGAFAMGAIGGGIWNSVKGARNSPRGERLQGSVSAVRARAPILGGELREVGAARSAASTIRL